ncbi:N-acetylglucosamine-6-phosphate deacetylase [Salipiger aestuarii]|uniref:N-acetylglucosamine-6-phosphate deacetylase n=1 Tax=Salipiger aestuarii TaxID=568098 RepID=A0A327YH41_9RHOB|nr:N-acetylglucosamine-6-phosphate deacetylase [Salipiger aestuarii]KAB2542997.1 N-acetylglucosamine-6-phosphate deacetylase [Salipiger aestuarii]RAK19622.1 N-acetylglucosamine-6-phosphate deacetylase [Salipiger aestuarii]
MRQVIAPRGVWLDGALRPGMELVVDAGRLAQIRPRTDVAARAVTLVTPLLSDLQVNGGGGVMVNDMPTPDGLAAIARAHRALGTGDILPTVITDAPQVAEAAADAVLACRDEQGILGLHLEGPHLSPARRGTHAPQYLRPLDARTVALVERLRARDVPVMITLAPERADPALLAALVASKAVVSAGHSSATAEQAQEAFARGVTCVTHLFNAMDGMESRRPGLLGAAIDSKVACGLICDGIHVSWQMLRIALRARPEKGLCFAVSDAMETVGGADHFMLYGQRIDLRDGRLVNAEGALAGAHVSLRDCLVNLITRVGVPPDEAVAMTTDIPRRLMGLAPRRILPGMAMDDLLVLDAPELGSALGVG